MSVQTVADAREIFRIVNDACELWDAADEFDRQGQRGVYFAALVESTGWDWERVKAAVDSLVAIGTLAVADYFYTRIFTPQPVARDVADQVMATIRRKERNVDAYEMGDGL